MNIGIIGTGALGAQLARAFAQQGLEVTVANKSGAAAIADLLASSAQIKAGTVAQAASADVVVVAVPWVATESVLSGLPAWNNRIVIDATNPVIFLTPESPEANDPTNPLAAYGIKAIDLAGQHSSAVLSQYVEGARVVKAFNHLDANVLSEPHVAGGQRTLFYAGDDADAKATVRQLIEQIGFFAVDLGLLDVGAPLIELPFGALAMHNLVKV